MGRSKQYYHPQSAFFKQHNIPAPETISHGTEDNIEEKFKKNKLHPQSWRLEGNKLIAQTEAGQLVNYIGTDYVCDGTDDEGKPILRKIVV